MSIAKSQYLSQSIDTIQSAVPSASADWELKKMNMCQAINNALDQSMEKDEKTGKIIIINCKF